MRVRLNGFLVFIYIFVFVVICEVKGILQGYFVWFYQVVLLVISWAVVTEYFCVLVYLSVDCEDLYINEFKILRIQFGVKLVLLKYELFLGQ